MKKQLILVFALLMVAFSATAEKKLQVKAYDGTFTFGAKAAMNLPHFYGGILPHGFRNGGQIGVWTEYRPNSEKLKHWSIAPELVFSSQGGKFTVNQVLSESFGLKYQLSGLLSALNKKIVFTTNYINIPIMIKYRFFPELSVEAGPQIGFNVYSKAHIDGVDGNLNLNQFTNTVNVGVGAGATYYLTNDIMFHVRYNIDFINTFNYFDDRNGNIQFGIGYRF